jgi:hypothetical protein
MPKLYDEKWSKSPEPEKVATNIRPIEGGRAIAAQAVLSEFASETETVSTTSQDMAGFLVIAWDDEGGMVSAFHNAPRSPFSAELLTTILTDKVKSVINSVTQ